MARDISASMVLIARQLGAKFYLHDRFLTHEQVFSPVGLLPALAMRADRLCSLCIGFGLGVSFEDAEDAMLGKRVIFDERSPRSLRLLYLTDILEELIQGGMGPDYVVLDELMFD